jgi:hypothetical protein
MGIAGSFCRLTQKNHSIETPRVRTPSSCNRINQKDKFYQHAKIVISCISQIEITTSTIEHLAMRCLDLFSDMKDNETAFSKISTIKAEYVVLALLYLLKDGMHTPEGVHIIPKEDSLASILPNICEIHKCTYDNKRRTSKKLKRSGVQKDVGIRKKTLTNTSRQVVEALRCVSQSK